MSQLPAFRYNGQNGRGAVESAGQLPSLSAMGQSKLQQRTRIWELSTNLHCSIIGTCLTGADLRQFLRKMGDDDVKSATDHVLHTRGVVSAARADITGKSLNKLLDRRHERSIKRFSRMKTPDEIRQLWRECYDEGEIPGAYWAVLTHPLTDRKLVNDVFGDVHMLSHLVGSASRLDIARLQMLQRDAELHVEKIQKQQSRLRLAALERQQLRQRVAVLEVALLAAQRPRATIDERSKSIADAANSRRLQAETTRADMLSTRLSVMETSLKAAEVRAAASASECDALQREVSALETRLFDGCDAKSPTTHSPGASLLYVGGRRNLFERLRSLAGERGFELVVHDGGIEDNNSQLPSLVGQADVALLPVDCVSHSATLLVKRLCHEAGKRFLPLRAASLASFLASLDVITQSGT